MEDCAKACLSYNFNRGRKDCKAVVFRALLAEAAVNFGSCFLKTQTTLMEIQKSNKDKVAMILQ